MTEFSKNYNNHIRNNILPQSHRLNNFCGVTKYYKSKLRIIFMIMFTTMNEDNPVGMMIIYISE